jgi:hypothetical protein
MATRPEFGPSLPELLAPRLHLSPRALRVALLAFAVLLVALFALRKVGQTAGGLTHDVLVTRPTPFTLGYRDGLERVAPGPGELLRLRTPAGSSAPQLFTVAPLALPAYRGDQAGVLPVVASRDVATLRRAFPTGFLYRGDGRTRINLIPGHQVLFQTRRDGRTTYGKRYFLLPDLPGARVGVVITLLSARSPALPTVASVGVNGLLKGPLRSFRFGTERP